MIWYYTVGNPMKTVGFVQVRGINQPLAKDELKMHVDKLWERYYQTKKLERNDP